MSQLSENEIERIASGRPKLTPAQQKAIYPGPGNPLYAKGRLATINALEQLGLVTQVSIWTCDGAVSATLTEAGRAERINLERQSKP